MGQDVAREWLQRGQKLEAAGQYSHALVAYDAAIAIQADADFAETTAASRGDSRRELGIAWMNRGNAAQKIGTAPAVAEAVQAYDHAIALFGERHPDPSGTSQNHLGAAWLNRGHALLLASASTAVDSFENAIAALSLGPGRDNAFVRRNLAGAYTNLAHALLTAVPEGNAAVGPPLARGLICPRAASEAASKLGLYTRAWHSARAALSIICGYEHPQLDFMAMSLRARRALVMALGELLADAGHAGTPTAELRAEASDAIEDGLALTLTLGPAEFRELRPLAERLFRLGVQLYGTHQPHFLGEFILDLMASPSFAEDAMFVDIARSALAEALALRRASPFLTRGTPAAERALLTARSVRAAQDALERRLPRAAARD